MPKSFQQSSVMSEAQKNRILIIRLLYFYSWAIDTNVPCLEDTHFATHTRKRARAAKCNQGIRFADDLSLLSRTVTMAALALASAKEDARPGTWQNKFCQGTCQAEDAKVNVEVSLGNALL